MLRMTVLPLATVLALVHSVASAQLLPDPTSVLSTSPTLVNGVLTIGNSVFQPDDASTQEELPGLGHKFELLGNMVRDIDPQNLSGHSGNAGGGAGGNEVISSSFAAGSLDVALAYRKLGSGIKIKALTNQIGLKYYFVAPRTCSGGSPRVTLLIDSDSDGDTDFAAHGHVNPPFYAACAMGTWKYEDLTDELPRWEVTPAVAGTFIPGVRAGYTPWKDFAAAVTAGAPNHTITAGFLVDDSCSFSAAGCGKAYYDLLTIENRTLEIWQDTVKK